MIFLLIGGLQKTTLIDFPGRVACTVFTVGCNFRCPFCHNRDLVTLNNFKNSGLPTISEQYFFEFLDKRKKILDGVCITGGEPTLQSDLPQFCEKIKKLGLAVKLDTNGSNPEILNDLIKLGRVNYIAMDIKSDFNSYERVINIKNQKSKIKNTNQKSKITEKIIKSIKIILQSHIEYEFRTTIVPGIHNKENMVKLAKELKNEVSKVPNVSKVSEVNWVLQNFRPQNCLDQKFLKIKQFTSGELKEILMAVRQVLPKARLRGED